jgi:hypothetical protein
VRVAEVAGRRDSGWVKLIGSGGEVNRMPKEVGLV